MEPAAPIAVFVRNLQATFGERALEVARTQRDAASDGSVHAGWAHIVELLTHANESEYQAACEAVSLAERAINHSPSRLGS